MVVAHSMGYAYAAGILDALLDLEVLAEGNTLGGFYILAPENAVGRNIDAIIENTDVVWQYGTRELGSDDSNKPRHQDGIAPQVGVPGLSFQIDNQFSRGRIKYQGKLVLFGGFGIHHLGTSYDWVIKNIESDDDGYVQPR